jgi:cell division protein FtsB
MYSEIQKLKTKNIRLGLEIHDLRKGRNVLEELARTDLGMVKKNEIFLQVFNSNGRN